MLLEGLQVQRVALETLPSDHRAEGPQQPRPVPLGLQQQVCGGGGGLRLSRILFPQKCLMNSNFHKLGEITVVLGELLLCKNVNYNLYFAF